MYYHGRTGEYNPYIIISPGRVPRALSHKKQGCSKEKPCFVRICPDTIRHESKILLYIRITPASRGTDNLPIRKISCQNQAVPDYIYIIFHFSHMSMHHMEIFLQLFARTYVQNRDFYLKYTKQGDRILCTEYNSSSLAGLNITKKERIKC